PGEHLGAAQMALALAILAQGQVVPAERPSRLDLARPRHAEALHGTPLGFQLRHFPSDLEKGSGLVPQAASEINSGDAAIMPWSPRRPRRAAESKPMRWQDVASHSPWMVAGARWKEVERSAHSVALPRADRRAAPDHPRPAAVAPAGRAAAA